jgi:hypothetical protein
VFFATFCGHIKIYSPVYPCLIALKAIFGQLHIESHGIAAVKTGFAKIIIRAFDSICRHSAWKNGCDTLTVVGLYENWTLALSFQVSAQPLA